MPTGELSPDGNYFWDGQKWASATSPDARWRWNGTQWIPASPVLAASLTPLVPLTPGALAVQPKNPAVSLIISFFIPGVGSMVNGDVGTGVAILVLWIVGIALSIFIIGFAVIIGAWIWGMIDAYQGAQRWNRNHGILS